LTGTHIFIVPILHYSVDPFYLLFGLLARLLHPIKVHWYNSTSSFLVLSYCLYT